MSKPTTQLRPPPNNKVSPSRLWPMSCLAWFPPSFLGQSTQNKSNTVATSSRLHNNWVRSSNNGNNYSKTSDIGLPRSSDPDILEVGLILTLKSCSWPCVLKLKACCEKFISLLFSVALSSSSLLSTLIWHWVSLDGCRKLPHCLMYRLKCVERLIISV